MSDRKQKAALGKAPFTDGKAAEPHYQDLISPEAIKVTPSPTPPDAEPMAPGVLKTPDNRSEKSEFLDCFRQTGEGHALTTNIGVRIAENQDTLKAGSRGPTLLEDFHFLEKMSHFDSERIPERVMHARGSGAHGYFQVYKSLAEYTRADFLQDPETITPVFVRFSTAQGFRGSADTVRDIRGFAVKFYTREGNFDLVGNNTPVFFIQDAIKFPDFVHALKPEPHNQIPQGQSAHDTFWDYISLQPETLHNVMWAMSDRGIPRSYRTIEGFGIHTFRMINAEGKQYLVRFHWKPRYGTASLIWDEAQEIAGRDPDYHRKDLWQAIEAGDYPEYELGLQIIQEGDEEKFDFDIFDPTKLIPETLVPVHIVGKMVLNRNPDNFFAETEQIAFCPANIVPGIDFSEDPLLLGRVFSYVDAQRYRLGGPNFNLLPINRAICPVRNHQRDGFHRTPIEGDANYEPNSISGNWPREIPVEQGGFVSHPGKLTGNKIRRRSPSFSDYFSQPRLFWLSQTAPEQAHIVNAFSFELSKVYRPYIRERVVDLLTHVDHDLARRVAENLGIVLTREQLSRDLPGPVSGVEQDPALSLYARDNQEIKSRRVALLVADGVCGKCVEAVCASLQDAGVHPQILAPRRGPIKTAQGNELVPQGCISGVPSVLVDAVIVPDGEKSLETLCADGEVKYYLLQAYKHLKAIGVAGSARRLLDAAGLGKAKDSGLVIAEDARQLMPAFLTAMKKHRAWDREEAAKAVPAK